MFSFSRVDVRNDTAFGSLFKAVEMPHFMRPIIIMPNAINRRKGIYLEVCYLAANSCPTVQPRFNRFSPFFSNNVGESRSKSVSSRPLHDRRLLISTIPMSRNTPFPLSPSKTCYMCQKVCLSPRRSVPIFRPCPAAAAPAGWRHERHSLQQNRRRARTRVA